MTGETWTILWDEYTADTYLYGSKVIYHKKDDVEFFNPLMPPGTIIKKWYSKTDYKSQRIEPQLPMIDGESEYEITVNIDVPKGQSCLIRLVFFDRYGQEAGYLNVWDEKMDFKCPLKTYSYCMQLVNGGMNHFHFHNIVIREKENDAGKKNKKTK